MLRIIKLLFSLLLIAFVGLVGYAYLGDMAPTRTEMSEPVELNVDQ